MPSPEHRESYGPARAALLEYVASRPDLRAVYEFGTVQAPGVSDLDLVFVAADQPQPDLAQYLSIEHLPPVVARLMNGGTLMVMRASEFCSMSWWDDVNVHRLRGQAFTLDEPRGEQLRAVEVARVIDWLPERTARLLALAAGETLPVQQALCLMHSIGYTFRRLQRSFAISPAAMGDCLHDIGRLRGQWFDMPASQGSEMLVDLLDRVTGLAVACLHEFGAWCSGQGIFAVPAPHGAAMSLGARMRFEFVSSERITIANARARSTAERAVVPVPRELWGHFAEYGRAGGPLSTRLAGAMTPPPAAGGGCDPIMAQVLAMRMDLAERMAAFLRANHFRAGLWKLGWFL